MAKRDREKENKMIERGEPIVDDDGVYSKLRVLRSAAGYYIGRIFEGKDGFMEPGSRESGYYPDEASATNDLLNDSYEFRNCVENQFLYRKKK